MKARVEFVGDRDREYFLRIAIQPFHSLIIRRHELINRRRIEDISILIPEHPVGVFACVNAMPDEMRARYDVVRASLPPHDGISFDFEPRFPVVHRDLPEIGIGQFLEKFLFGDAGKLRKYADAAVAFVLLPECLGLGKLRCSLQISVIAGSHAPPPEKLNERMLKSLPYNGKAPQKERCGPWESSKST